MGDTSGWITNGTASVAVSTAQIHLDNYSGLVTGRTDASQGAGRSMTYQVNSGTTYRIEGWVRLQNAAADNLTLTLSYTDSLGTHTSVIDQITAYENQWILLDGAIALNAVGSITDISFYFNGPAAGVNFYIDDAAFTVLSADIDHSGSVDIFDFGLFAKYYQRDCNTQDCGPADIEQCDNAETVDEHDLAIIISNWLVGVQ
jgi:hypothetical protein